MGIDEGGDQEEGIGVLVGEEAGAAFGEIVSFVGREDVEADVFRRHLLGHVKLAAVGSFVSGPAQHPAQTLIAVRIRDRLDVAIIVVAHADLAGQASGHQAETGRAAHGIAAIGALKTHAAGGQAVHGRCLQIAIAGATHHGRTLLVRHDHQDVGAIRCHCCNSVVSLRLGFDRPRIRRMRLISADKNRKDPVLSVLSAISACLSLFPHRIRVWY